MDRGSNHPNQVFKHIPKGIEHRLSTNSSNKDIFERRKQVYEKALKALALTWNIKIEREIIHKKEEKDLEKSYGLTPRIT